MAPPEVSIRSKAETGELWHPNRPTDPSSRRSALNLRSTSITTQPEREWTSVRSSSLRPSVASSGFSPSSGAPGSGGAARVAPVTPVGGGRQHASLTRDRLVSGSLQMYSLCLKVKARSHCMHRSLLSRQGTGLPSNIRLGASETR